MTKKHLILTILSVIILFGISIYLGRPGPEIEVTYQKTASDKIEDAISEGKVDVIKTYYKMDDGTYTVENYSVVYKDRVELVGNPGGSKTVTLVVLTNIEEVTFDEAWQDVMESDEYNTVLNPKESIVVAMRIKNSDENNSPIYITNLPVGGH